jgi:broad specificity phosphatase PhoE
MTKFFHEPPASHRADPPKAAREHGDPGSSFVPVTRILLLRHGQSEWNALGRWQGQADPPLSDLGRQQAHHAGNRLADGGSRFRVAFASDLRRAAETARIIALRLEIEVRPEPALRERHVGSWEGLTRDEIEARWPGWLDERRRPDDFESDGSVLARARAAIATMHAAEPDETVLAFCHGGVIFSVERSLDAPYEHLPNLAGRWLTVTDAGEWDLGERVTLVELDELTVPRQL